MTYKTSIYALAAILLIAVPGASYGENESISFEAVYTSDLLRNASGGIAEGSAYLDNLDLTLEIDAEALWGLPGVEVFLYGLYNNGTSFSERYVGDAQVVSNIETGEQALRLYEAWVQFAAGETTNFRFGLYDLNSEFDALEASQLFMGSAHGIGTEISQSGVNGPSIFPNTSLALRTHAQLNDTWHLLVGVLDGVPGDPDETDKTAVQLSSRDGALVISELQRVRSSSRLLLGAWSYTSKTDSLSGQGTTNDRRRNAGAYVRGEAVISESKGELMAFGRFGIADDNVNLFSRFYSGGLTWRSFMQNRPSDELGIAFAWAEASGSAPVTAEKREIAYELTYRMQVTDWFAVQPNIQYVQNPGLDPALDNALVVGARFEFQLN